MSVVAFAPQAPPHVNLDDALTVETARRRVKEVHESRTHNGNAKRLAALTDGQLRFAYGLGWLSYDGTRFLKDTPGKIEAGGSAAARRQAIRVAESLHEEATAAFTLLDKIPKDSDVWSDVLKMAREISTWARNSEQATNIKSTLDVATAFEEIGVDATELDANPDLLNVQNGTLDLTTFELRDHRQEDLITKITNAALDPAALQDDFDIDAAAPNWTSNLKRFIPDQEVRDYLQRVAGQALFGARSEDLLYLYGLGANFKSTFLRALRDAIGDYAYVTDSDVLVKGPGKKSVSDKAVSAELQGKRLVTMSEIEADQPLAEAMLKLLTEDTIRAEFKYRDGFNFAPQMNLMLSANHKLRVDGIDEGTWRRIHLIEFGVQLPVEERDPLYYETHLAPELDGILAWMVRGAKAYMEQGGSASRCNPPEQVRAWSQAYQEQNDIIAKWIGERCVLDTDAETSTRELFADFAEFAKSERMTLSQSEWKKRMQAAGYHDARVRMDGSQVTVFQGIRTTI